MRGAEIRGSVRNITRASFTDIPWSPKARRSSTEHTFAPHARSGRKQGPDESIVQKCRAESLSRARLRVSGTRYSGFPGTFSGELTPTRSITRHATRRNFISYPYIFGCFRIQAVGKGYRQTSGTPGTRQNRQKSLDKNASKIHAVRKYKTCCFVHESIIKQKTSNKHD